MGVVGLNAVVMPDDHQVSIAAIIAGLDDGTAVGRLDSFSIGGVDVQTGVVVGLAKDFPAAEIRVDAPGAGRPNKRALRGRLRFLLGAHGLNRGGGFPQGGGLQNGAVPLIAVNIDHIGFNLGLALLPLGEDLGVSLIHGVVLHRLHRTSNRLGVGHLFGGLDGQGGDDLLDIEHIPHHQAVNVGVRVKLHQVAERHIVSVGDAIIGVALDHSIGGLPGGVGLESLLNLSHVHQVVHSVDRIHRQILHKPGGHCVLGDILFLDAVQHGGQSRLILHRANDPPIHRHLVGPQLVTDLVELLIKKVADILFPAEVTF